MPRFHRILSRPLLQGTALYLFSFGIILFFFREGFVVWDDWEHIRQSQWLVSLYGLSPAPPQEPSDILKWYGPLWELLMGFITFVILPTWHDPALIRHALTAALFPLTLWGIYRLLRREGLSTSHAGLCVAGLGGIIRFGGHALINTKDFPFAAAFLWITLALWQLLKTEMQKQKSARRWLLLGVLSILPYLLRPPVLLHTALLSGLLLLWIALDFQERRTHWIRSLGYFWSGSALAIFILYPTVRLYGLGAWIQSFGLFSKFPLRLPVRLWGVTWPSDALPFWYPFAWIPVIMIPPVFALLLWGLARGWKKRLPSIEIIPDRVSLNLRTWLAVFTGLAWAAVLWKRPILYDEERHLLFLFPPLVLVAFLGFSNWSRKTHLLMSGLIVFWSLASYGQWKTFSYVYKSLLSGGRSADRFMGDYWGSCVGTALSKLAGKIPPNATLTIVGPGGIGPLELDRLRESSWAHQKGYEHMTYVEPSMARPPFMALGINRVDMLQGIQNLLMQGKAQKILSVEMPPGDEACVAVWVPSTP